MIARELRRTRISIPRGERMVPKEARIYFCQRALTTGWGKVQMESKRILTTLPSSMRRTKPARRPNSKLKLAKISFNNLPGPSLEACQRTMALTQAFALTILMKTSPSWTNRIQRRGKRKRSQQSHSLRVSLSRNKLQSRPPTQLSWPVQNSEKVKMYPK